MDGLGWIGVVAHLEGTLGNDALQFLRTTGNVNLGGSGIHKGCDVRPSRVTLEEQFIGQSEISSIRHI